MLVDMYNHTVERLFQFTHEYLANTLSYVRHQCIHEMQTMQRGNPEILTSSDEGCALVYHASDLTLGQLAIIARPFYNMLTACSERSVRSTAIIPEAQVHLPSAHGTHRLSDGLVRFGSDESRHGCTTADLRRKFSDTDINHSMLVIAGHPYLHQLLIHEQKDGHEIPVLDRHTLPLTFSLVIYKLDNQGFYRMYTSCLPTSASGIFTRAKWSIRTNKREMKRMANDFRETVQQLHDVSIGKVNYYVHGSS